jgi:hypothetical protein
MKKFIARRKTKLTNPETVKKKLVVTPIAAPIMVKNGKSEKIKFLVKFFIIGVI